MKKIAIIICSVLLFISCEEKDVRLYPSIINKAKVIVNQQGAFDKSAQISTSEISNSISDVELDASGVIEDITTENVSLKVKRLSGNKAESVKLDLSIEVNESGDKYILDDFVFTIPENEAEYNISKSLKSEGVRELTKQLFNVVVNKNTDTDIEFSFEGTPTPENSNINVEIEIKLQNGLVFKQTIDAI